MPKQLFRGWSVVLFMFLITGCASSNPNAGGITTKAYVTDKERVDQNMEGNFGYLAGTPKPIDRSQLKKTRKVYVMEFIKEAPDVDDIATTPEAAATSAPSSEYTGQKEQAQEPQGRTIELPTFGEERTVARERAVEQSSGQEEAGMVAEGTVYTVQKDDTLQKISKKFYNTYSKWPKIYEANKNVITNPNRIKSGIKLVIPQL